MRPVREALRAAVIWILVAPLCIAAPAVVHAQDLPEPAIRDVSEDAVFSIDSPIGPIEYLPARGLRFGRTGLNIGGFKVYEFQKERGDDWFFAIDSINFLVLLQPIQRLRVFTEVEVGDIFEANLGTEETSSHAFANIERLYADFSVVDSLNLQGGKFQTPVGEWNLVPAEPFTPTALEPVLLESFDEHQTGGMVHGSFFPQSGTLQYWAWGQGGALDPESDEDPTDYGVGSRVRYSAPHDAWSLGTSFLASSRSDDWGYLAGADGHWRCGPFELSSEFVHTWGARENLLRWDLFLQGSLEVLPSFFLNARYEHSSFNEMLSNVEIGDVGVTWTPIPYLILKAGYRFTDRLNEEVTEGFKGSISVIF